MYMCVNPTCHLCVFSGTATARARSLQLQLADEPASQNDSRRQSGSI